MVLAAGENNKCFYYNIIEAQFLNKMFILSQNHIYIYRRIKNRYNE